MTKIIELDETDSTNEYCKRYAGGEDMIVTALRQTKGKGTNGRSFASDEGGLYLSTLKRYENFDFKNTFSIMVNACVAVCRTVENFGVKPTVKWANDVLAGGRKICGTLIENKLGADNICTSVVGIGLNVNNVLPEELRDIATTLSEQRGKKIPLNRVRSALIKNLGGQYTIADYKRYVDWFGKEVWLESNGERSEAVALDVEADGRLVCMIDGKIKKISSAEMRLRFKCRSI